MVTVKGLIVDSIEGDDSNFRDMVFLLLDYLLSAISRVYDCSFSGISCIGLSHGALGSDCCV